MRESQYTGQSVAAVVLALSMAGCATLDREECFMADWRTVGFEDGRNGHLSSYVGKHREACAAHGVAPDLEAYLAGHARGIAEHCRPQNGFQLGLHGRAYRGECPAELEAAYVASHTDGYRLRERRAVVERLRRQIDQNLEEEDQLNQTIFERRETLAAPETSRRQRRAIREEIEELVIERRRSLRVIRRLEDDLDQALLDLESYQRYLDAR